jgi:hypothetical protein
VPIANARRRNAMNRIVLCWLSIFHAKYQILEQAEREIEAVSAEQRDPPFGLERSFNPTPLQLRRRYKQTY